MAKKENAPAWQNVGASVDERLDSFLDETGGGPAASDELPLEIIDESKIKQRPPKGFPVDPMLDDAPRKDPKRPETSMSGFIPELEQMFPDAGVLVTEIRDMTGVNLDTAERKRDWTIRETIEPKDLYDERLNPKLNNLALYFLSGSDSPECKLKFDRSEVIWLIQMANGRGVGLVGLLRQKLWEILWNKRVDERDEAFHFSDREKDHDRVLQGGVPADIDSQRLARLLGFTCYEELNRLAQKCNAAPATLFRALVRFARDNKLL